MTTEIDFFGETGGQMDGGNNNRLMNCEPQSKNCGPFVETKLFVIHLL